MSQISESTLFTDVCAIIEDTRFRVAVYVNSEACKMNWHVGMRIKEDLLHNTRAEYGSENDYAVRRQLRWTHLLYLMLDEDSPIKAAQYYTKLPDKKLLSEKLQRAIAIAKEYQRNKEKDNEGPLFD